MKQRIFLLLMCLLAAVAIHAQGGELRVKSFRPLPTDLAASAAKVTDREKNLAALIKVQLPLEGVVFASSNVIKQEFLDGEYWVFLAEGTHSFGIKHPKYYKLDVELRDIVENDPYFRLESGATYELVVQMPQYQPAEQDTRKGYLVLTVTPANSIVKIDGLDVMLESDGTAMQSLPYGRHTFTAAASGYATEEGFFDIPQGVKRTPKTISLKSTMASVTITCPTPGAEIYVNDKLRGTSPWSGQLAKGSHIVEARLKGHHTGRQDITLQERETRSILLPDLAPMTGTLDVAYRPIDAEVWIDGQRRGLSPDVFGGITVGEHRVELRKDGYQSKQETVTIREAQTTTLTGQLTAITTPSTVAAATAQAGSNITITIPGTNVSFTMVYVEGGTFTMGATRKRDGYQFGKHRVTLSDYYIGETEVTQALWEAVMDSNPSHFKGDGNLPVENVSWDDCQTFITKLNSLTGRNFKLPTEAQWEYAARGGSKSSGYKYSGGNDPGSVAWYCDNSGRKTHPVKTKKANELGIYDMSGNVWEWCSDWYDDSFYNKSPKKDPENTTEASIRVYRGGCWTNNAEYCRSAGRFNFLPSFRYSFIGVRLALQ